MSQVLGRSAQTSSELGLRTAHICSASRVKNARTTAGAQRAQCRHTAHASMHRNPVIFTLLGNGCHLKVQQGFASGFTSVRGISRCRAVDQEEASTALSEDSKQDEEQSSGTVAQAAMWLFFAVYITYLILLPIAPGEPIYAMRWSSLKTVLDMSLNFFFILPIQNAVGIHVLESPVVHPAYEALFNFVNAWSLMFGPLLLAERRLSPKTAALLWTGQMFLTNVFLTPYMALRLGKESKERSPGRLSSSKDSIAEKFRSTLVSSAPAVGVTGALVGVTAIYWYIAGRSDGNFGGLTERWQYLVDLTSSDRIAYAFIFDLVLYAAFQGWLIRDANKRRGADTGLMQVLGFIPFFGLAGYLCFGTQEQALEEDQ